MSQCISGCLCMNMCMKYRCLGDDIQKNNNLASWLGLPLGTINENLTHWLEVVDLLD